MRAVRVLRDIPNHARPVARPPQPVNFSGYVVEVATWVIDQRKGLLNGVSTDETSREVGLCRIVADEEAKGVYRAYLSGRGYRLTKLRFCLRRPNSAE
ncbi:MAG: hypothetical protein AAGG69_13160 [Pseudomonadota bacterium]